MTLTFNLSDELVAVNEAFSTCKKKKHLKTQEVTSYEDLTHDGDMMMRRVCGYMKPQFD